MTREEAKVYFKDNNERIITVAKDENRYNYKTQQIEDVCMRRTFEANELASKALEQEPCEDWNAVLDELNRIGRNAFKDDADYDSLFNFISGLPNVKQEQKTGHWIKTPKAVMGEGYMWYCDKCEHQVYQDSSRPYPSEKYCSNCGAEMAESEGKE